MKVIAVLVLLATCSFALKHRSSNPMKSIEELQKSTYGNTLLHMIQLHSDAQGPVQELLEAIEELINDLNEELVELDANFAQRTAEHNQYVIELEQDISDAEIDIERAQDVMLNLLVPRRQQLENRIAQLQDNQALNRKTLAEVNLVRQQDHAAYEAQVEDLNAATAAVDEALQLLATLTNPSLAEIKKFQNSLKKIESKIKAKSTISPMIKALINLASAQNFSNQDIIGSIVQALNEFRNAVVDQLNELTKQEADAVVEFEERVQQLDLEHAEFQRQINQVNVDLTAVIEKLKETQEYQDLRIRDKKMFTEQLELENNQYAEETETYTDLKNEYLRELAVSEQALAVVESGDFSGIHL